MENNTDCLFCKIIRKEIPANIVYEDNSTIAILDIHPVNIGHTLVIPKKHIENIYIFDEQDTQNVFTAVQKVSKAIKSGISADGINLIMNNERPSGQLVFHAHVHVIPRHNGDGLAQWKEGRGYKEGEAEEVVGKISSQL